MRKNHIIYALLLLVAGVQTSWSQGLKVWQDGQFVYHKFNEVDSVTFVNDVMEAVDLGLPSGTLWATCNVGASTPEGLGDAFAWGETEPKGKYNWATYKYAYFEYADSTVKMTKYCSNKRYGRVDYKVMLDAEDDAATMNWGSEWQMPTSKQLEELFDRYTSHEITSQDGIIGMLITSKSNGNSIFLPENFYWTRNLDSEWHTDDYNVFSIGFREDAWYMSLKERCEGHYVRPVRKPNIKFVESIELSTTSLTLQQGNIENIFASVLPYDADVQGVTWETSNENVATVTFEPSDGTFDSTGAPAGNFCTVTAVGGGTCDIICRATDGSGVLAICHVRVEGGGSIDGYEFVDLGLPSGTLWATTNLGASSPEQYGDFFAWGETEAKSNYTWTTYKWMSEARDNFRYINKYTIPDNETEGHWYLGDIFIGDRKTELVAADDAASKNRSIEWQMPSRAQFEELVNSLYTSVEWTTMSGVSGIKVTSKKNRQSIFLPAAGHHDEGNSLFEGLIGFYWTRTLRLDWSGMAYQLAFHEQGAETAEGYRYSGASIRPVVAKEAEEHEYIDLDLPSGTLWATCNVGASTPEEYGSHYAWGETAPKEEYNWSTYKHCDGAENTLTKYCFTEKLSWSGSYTDYIDKLMLSDDAAAVNWGYDWRMPNDDQLNELINDSYTTKKHVTQNGVRGLKITSKSNGKSIFLPGAGVRNNSSVINEGDAFYWTNTLNSGWMLDDCAYYLDEQDVVFHGLRSVGRSIRPVKVEKHESVDLGLPSGTLWATCNIGANSPAEYGDYFAWGETEPKESYTWDTYKYGTYGAITKYVANDSNAELMLLPEDDAATVKWGDEWQMPSIAQWEELTNSDYTLLQLERMNGIYGLKITSKQNGRSVFMPAAGSFNSHDNSKGSYWLRSSTGLESSNSNVACFFYNDYRQYDVITIGNTFRCEGYPVRPVRKQ